MLKEILFTVAIRPIISELHILKKLGLLCGHTPEEEYDYFVRHYLKDAEYQQGFFRKYPEAYRLCQISGERRTRLLSGDNDAAGERS